MARLLWEVGIGRTWRKRRRAWPITIKRRVWWSVVWFSRESARLIYSTVDLATSSEHTYIYALNNSLDTALLLDNYQSNGTQPCSLDSSPSEWARGMNERGKEITAEKLLIFRSTAQGLAKNLYKWSPKRWQESAKVSANEGRAQMIRARPLINIPWWQWECSM